MPASTSTLLLRLDGPVQAWGDDTSTWDHRHTADHPSKAAVIGLVANALGRTRDDDITDLAALRYAVRADRPGRIEFDFRTAGGATFPLDNLTANLNPNMSKRRQPGDPVPYGAPRAGADMAWSPSARAVTFRHQTYLVDAAFIASLTGPTPLLQQIHQALTEPARPLFLGRRSMPPAHPIAYQLLDGDQHTTWTTTQSLLDRATTTSPTAWTQATDPTTGTLTYTQPVSYRTRHHQPLTMTTAPTNPPEHEPIP